jgi:hypothetical protein
MTIIQLPHAILTADELHVKMQTIDNIKIHPASSRQLVHPYKMRMRPMNGIAVPTVQSKVDPVPTDDVPRIDSWS